MITINDARALCIYELGRGRFAPQRNTSCWKLEKESWENPKMECSSPFGKIMFCVTCRMSIKDPELRRKGFQVRAHAKLPHVGSPRNGYRVKDSSKQQIVVDVVKRVFIGEVMVLGYWTRRQRQVFRSYRWYVSHLGCTGNQNGS